MKIGSILPYKENYTEKGAGAVALWIYDFMRDSRYKKSTIVIGSTKYKRFLSKNYINIDINDINSKLESTTKKYSNKIISRIKDIKCPYEDCESNTQGKEKEVIYIKYNTQDMAFLYCCTLCQKKWTSSSVKLD